MNHLIRVLIDPNEVADYYLDWHELYQEILDYASD